MRKAYELHSGVMPVWQCVGNFVFFFGICVSRKNFCRLEVSDDERGDSFLFSSTAIFEMVL